jgi:hypothetical protein
MKKATLPLIFQPFEAQDYIRLGKDYDGGYLVSKNDVTRATSLVSFGVGQDTSFEKDFYEINPCSIKAFDEIAFNLNNFFAANKTITQQRVQRGPWFDNLLAGCGPNTFLKCDIEGAEYDLLNDLIKHSSKFCSMVIEFHDIQNPNNFDRLTNFLGKVEQKLIHTHINNNFYYYDREQVIPSVIELTFSSGETMFNPSKKLPHSLDMPNHENRGDIQVLWTHQR